MQKKIISELDYRTFEIIQSEEQREKKKAYRTDGT